MGTIVCVEPSVSEEDSVVFCSQADTLAYPHVDSCMTVTVFLQDGSVWGAHSPIYGSHDDFGSRDMATNALVRMCQKISAVIQPPITKIVFVGFNTRKGIGDGTHYRISKAMGVFGLSKQFQGWAFVNTRNSDGPIDVFFDRPSQTLSVQNCDKGEQRAFLDAPALRQQAVFYTTAFNNLAGKIIEPPDSF